VPVEPLARTDLHHGWTVRAVAGPVPDTIAGREIAATVPGSVTTDLLAAGLIPDPYLDRNEESVAWIGHCDWRYHLRFTSRAAGTGERVDLVCGGLDTVATVELNGTVLGHPANMHRSWRFDASTAICDGDNDLSITFAAPMAAAAAMSEVLGDRPRALEAPFNAIRKMACNFGWDWGPVLATSGIWRPIGLERWQQARIASVRPLVHVRGGDGIHADGTAEIHVELEAAPGSQAPLRVTAAVAGHSAHADIPPGDHRVTLALDVPGIRLWWPAGQGEQPLYGLQVGLAAGDPGGGMLDSWAGRIGFRTVTLDVGPDEAGTRFGIVVNGRAIPVRGANWIPDDCFPGRLRRAGYERALRDATEANMNLLRVWGGGIYESDDFYDLADELGLLVWQDFLFACAAYAEEEPLRSEILAEAREAVTRLSPHPSLAVWNGCNENLWGHEDWGWKEPLGERTWGAGYYFGLLPAVVAELDPARPYSPGSPWSFSADIHPNDPRHGTSHVWDVWNARDYTAYRQYRPRFVPEFGFQGPPAWATLERAVRERPLELGSPALLAHEKADNGMAKLAAGLQAHFPEPASIEDWHWATSLNQARAVTFGIEHWRSITPRCQGILVWQLNDCWPVISWAAVDGDGRRKPLWYALRRCYQDRLLTIQPAGDGLALLAVNDSPDPWRADLPLRALDFDGKLRDEELLTISAAPWSVAAVPLPALLAASPRPEQELLVAGDGPGRAVWYHREDKDLALPPPAVTAVAEPTAAGYQVTVEAATLQRDLALLADKAAPDAVVDDMLVTLLPGEKAVFAVRTATAVDPAELVSPRVLRSANQLLHTSAR
jgi:beta-mannosidase